MKRVHQLLGTVVEFFGTDHIFVSDQGVRMGARPYPAYPPWWAELGHAFGYGETAQEALDQLGDSMKRRGLTFPGGEEACP